MEKLRAELEETVNEIEALNKEIDALEITNDSKEPNEDTSWRIIHKLLGDSVSIEFSDLIPSEMINCLSRQCGPNGLYMSITDFVCEYGLTENESVRYSLIEVLNDIKTNSGKFDITVKRLTTDGKVLCYTIFKDCEITSIRMSDIGHSIDGFSKVAVYVSYGDEVNGTVN